MTAALQQRIQELEDENAILRRVILKEDVVPAAWNLTGKERRLVGALMTTKGVMSRDKLMDALYFDYGGDEPDHKIIDQFILRCRRKLKPFGISIQTHWGSGFSITVPA